MTGERRVRKIRVLSAALAAAGWVCLGVPAPASGIEIRDIPKPQRWVTDLTGSISSASITEIESTADRIERETGGQLVVVVVDTLNGKEPRPFAASLFNAWGIGSAEKDDGVLIFVALADRRIELLLGSGIDDSKRQRASDEIVQQVMVPQFKAGDPGGALVQGVEECARRIYGLAAPVASAPEVAPAPEAAPAPAVALPLPMVAPPPVYPASSSSESVENETGSLWVLGIMAGFVALAALFVVWVLRAGLFGPRECPSCKQSMMLLNESEDDAHLTAGELAEEGLGSANYDVWACSACAKVLKLRKGIFFTRYQRCPKCDFVTGSTWTTTLADATSRSMGQIQVDESCAFCDFSSSTLYWTPMIPPATRHSSYVFDDDSSSSSSGSSSSGSSSSGSSSSGSSSFGGGSTSGGGSSGRW